MRRTSAVIASGALWLAAAAQLLAGALQLHEAQGISADVTQRLSGRDTPASAAMRAYRALPVLAPALPLDARTLVVSQELEPVMFEFYLLPRPYLALYVLRDEGVAEVLKDQPMLRWLWQWRREQLVQRGALLSPTSLAQRLDWADRLIVFGAAPPELAPHATRLHWLAERDGVAVFEVVR